MGIFIVADQCANFQVFEISSVELLEPSHSIISFSFETFLMLRFQCNRNNFLLQSFVLGFSVSQLRYFINGD